MFTEGPVSRNRVIGRVRRSKVAGDRGLEARELKLKQPVERLSQNDQKDRWHSWSVTTSRGSKRDSSLLGSMRRDSIACLRLAADHRQCASATLLSFKG